MNRGNRRNQRRPVGSLRSFLEREGLTILGQTALCILALAIEFSAGCGSARPSKYYQLTVPGERAAAAGQDSYPVSLMIGPLMASHLYREDRIVYSSDGQRMGTYDSQRWAEPPAEMLEQLLLQQLRASGRYRSVSSLRSGARGDFLLRGRLYDFKEISGKTVVAKVSFELELQDTKTGSTVWTHSYSREEPANGRDVPAVVAALDRNAHNGVAGAAASLDQYFSVHSSK